MARPTFREGARLHLRWSRLHKRTSSMFPLPSARSLLAACRPSTWTSPLAVGLVFRASLGPSLVFARNRSQLAPRSVKFLKRHKGVLPVPTGGATKGTTLSYGQWGIRVKGNGMRITAKQLKSADDALKRKLKPIKGAKVYMRVFPDIPVCIKVRFVFSHAARTVCLSTV